MNPPRPERPSLRVATLNCWISQSARAERVASAAASLQELGAEVVCLQEVAGPAGEFAAGLCDALGWTQCELHLPPPDERGRVVGNAVISCHALSDPSIVELPPPSERTAASPYPHLLACRMEHLGREWLVGSTHLSWGSNAEATRLAQVQVVDQWFQQQCTPDRYGRSELPGVLAGDMNALAGMLSMRWMRGHDVAGGRSTQWVDCWRDAQLRHPTGHDGATSGPHNPWAAEGAAEVGIAHPELLPRRRVDYIYVRGYAYGSTGSPLQAGVWGGGIPEGHRVVASDHAGVWADLLV